VGRFSWLKDEDDLCNFPLGREVVEEQDGVDNWARYLVPIMGCSLRILPVMRS
jgi:hypothetical protein